MLYYKSFISYIWVDSVLHIAFFCSYNFRVFVHVCVKKSKLY